MRGGAMRSILIIWNHLLWLVLQDFGSCSETLRKCLNYYIHHPTTIRIEGDTIDLDIVRYGEKKQISFRICNTGEVPLLIRDVRPSCGCTEVRWEKRPVQPGEETLIFVTFEPNSLGRFMKSIEVLCNTSSQLLRLNLKGIVLNDR